MDSVQHQRRQGKLIDHLRFVMTVAEVADVIFMRHVGFGDDHRTGRDRIGNSAEQLNQQMGFFQMDAARAGGFPHIADGVETHIVRAFLQVVEQHPHHADQHLWIAEVKIDLIGAEGRPDKAHLAVRHLEGRQQRRGARPRYAAEIGGGWHADKEIVPAGVERQVVFEPGAVRGHMVADKIEHQARFLMQPGDIGPVAAQGVDLMVIDDGKAVVGRIGEKGQQMNQRKGGLQMLLIEAGKSLQRRDIRLAKLIRVGNQHDILLVPVRFARQLNRIARGGDLPQQALSRRLRKGVGINFIEQRCDRFHRELGATSRVVFYAGVLSA